MKVSRKGIIITIAVLVVLAAAFLILRKFIPRWLPVKESAAATNSMKRMSAPFSLYFDCDPADSVNFNKNELQKDVAHSGKFSAKAFGKDAYSLQINRKVSEIGVEHMKAVSMSAWIYVYPGDVPVNSTLVFAGFNGNKNICWNGVGVNGNQVPRGKWFKISGKIDLSSVPFDQDSHFQIYFWNNSSTDILIDDLYVVFGTPSERPGDTIYADMTKNGYNPQTNYPPFRTEYLYRSQILKDPAPLTGAGNKNRYFSGKFISSNADDILVAGKDKGTGIYSFCAASGKFVQAVSSLPQEINNAQNILTGSFSGNKRTQILIKEKNNLKIFEASASKDPCAASGADLKQIWTGTTDQVNNATGLTAADADGDGKSEIIALTDKGLILCRFSGSGWTVSELTGNNIPDPAKFSVRINAGKFLSGNDDQLLVVWAAKTGKESGYNLLRLNGKQLVSCFKGGKGQITGVDTLKINDEFITGDFGKPGQKTIFRYNRDWRFDLKEITFGDSGFIIQNVTDFKGYQSDRNPKYYESMKILPVILPGEGSSLLLILKNPASGMFPDAADLYSFRKEK